MAKKDYYQILGRQKRRESGRDQKIVSASGAEASPRRKSRRQSLRGQIQGSSGGLRRTFRREETQGFRPLRILRRQSGRRFAICVPEHRAAAERVQVRAALIFRALIFRMLGHVGRCRRFEFSRYFFRPFGGGGGRPERGRSPNLRGRCRKGPRHRDTSRMSFEEAFTGLTTNITVNRSEQCSRCQGAGDTGGPVVTMSDM